MMIRKHLTWLTAILVLGGCGAVYTFDGQKYSGKEDFYRAYSSAYSRAVSDVVPLQKPLTQKKLIFALPSEAVFIEESFNRFSKREGHPPAGQQREILENVTRANFEGTRVYFDAIRKKNIFASTQFVEMQSLSGSFAASDDSDVLFAVEPSQGSGQWYYTSIKRGKEVFAYDRSAPGITGKVQGFLDAVQVQAVRD